MNNYQDNPDYEYQENISNDDNNLDNYNNDGFND